jgi:hypothetical protein
VSRLLSTTGPSQAASVRIFQRLGWRLDGCVEAWPPYPALYAFEAEIGWPGVQADREVHGSLLDRLPGAAGAVAAGGAGRAREWVRCRDAAQLATAVADVRLRQRAWWRARRRERRQAGAAEEAAVAAADAAAAAAAAAAAEEEEEEEEEEGMEEGGEAAKDWLPWVYDVMGTRSSEAAELLASGHGADGVWLLPAAGCAGGGAGDAGSVASSGSSSSSRSSSSSSRAYGEGGADEAAAGGGGSSSCCSQHSIPDGSSQDGGREGATWDAVLVISPSKMFRRLAAGALVAGPGNVAACIARAAERGPHFVAFIDQGARYWGPPCEGGDRGAWPELYHLEGSAPSSSYYVFSKPPAAAANRGRTN